MRHNTSNFKERLGNDIAARLYRKHILVGLKRLYKVKVDKIDVNQLHNENALIMAY